MLLLITGCLSYADVASLEAKFQSCDKASADALILEASAWVNARVKNLSKSQIEDLFYKDTFESQLVTRFGSQYLPKDTRLSLGAKACGSYMQRYVESLKKKSPRKEEIKFWTTCIENDYRNNIPKIAELLINCRK